MIQVKDSYFDSFLSELKSDTIQNASEYDPLYIYTKKTFIIFVGSFITVMVCCIASQCLVRLSKNCRLQLNKYYSKKKYEKAKLI